MLNKDLGYTQEGVVYFPLSKGFDENFHSIKDQMLGYPSVKAMNRVGSPPTYGYNFSNSKFRWEGQNLSKETLFRALMVDYDYFSTLQIEMSQGRVFSEKFASDSSAVILNEAAIRETGIEDPVGKEIRFLLNDTAERRLTVVGVSKDYHFRSLHTDIEPQIIICDPSSCSWAMLKIQTDDFKTIESSLEKHWDATESPFPLNVEFLEESIFKLYEEDRAIRRIILFFTLIGLLISVLGLIGLTGFTIEQKAKEIGIRKLLGATLRDILGMISSDFLKWILISLLISVPISYLLMSRWLENFPYRIPLYWWLLILGGFIAMLVALITIGIQSQRAARTNPALSLRYE